MEDDVRNQDTTGWLAMVATPIGNLGDMTLRGLETLREATLVAAEDTRRARGLLAHYEISVRLCSYHAHNEHHRTQRLLDDVEAGERIALLTDAGTPSISDPGFLLVRAAVERGIEPRVIPGVSAMCFAATACGFPVTHFSFGGFLPPKGQKRRTKLEQMATGVPTLILYESPHRTSRLLADIAETLGEDTQVAIIREATKKHEETIRGEAGELARAFADRTWKGEVTMAIHRPTQ